MGIDRNKRKRRIQKSADNPFTAYTAIPVIRLTGPGATPPGHETPCIIASPKNYRFMPVRKVAYAIAHGWLDMNINVNARKMKLLRVKQSCGVDQCVNPDHLVGTEKEYEPYQ